MYLCVCMCVHVCIYVYICGDACKYTSVWTPEDNLYFFFRRCQPPFRDRVSDWSGTQHVG